MSNEPSTGGGGDQTLTEKGGESVSKFTEELLDGLVVVFTDYQDCMDEDTMDKWKQVDTHCTCTYTCSITQVVSSQKKGRGERGRRGGGGRE